MRSCRTTTGACWLMGCVLALVLVPRETLLAQARVASKLGNPETVVHNGKIVTVDDHSFTSDIGTIGQAMAVRDGRVLAVGTNEEIKALAGPNTKLIDLGGRTVVP